MGKCYVYRNNNDFNQLLYNMKAQAHIYNLLTKGEMKEKNTLMNEELLFMIRERTIQDVRNKLDRMVSYKRTRLEPLREYKFLFRGRFYTHTTPQMNCVICDELVDVVKTPKGEIIWKIGHNAEPVSAGRCCTDCDNTKVLPARLAPILGKGNEQRGKEIAEQMVKMKTAFTKSLNK